MTAAIDGELAARRRQALDRHVAGCTGCRREWALTERLLAALGTVAAEAAVPARLEQATIRQVREIAAVGARGGRTGWASSLLAPLPLAGAAAVAMLATGVLWFGESMPGSAVAPARSARPAEPTHKVARADGPRRPTGGAQMAETVPPPEPPAELAASPELFMELQILRNMEKLRNFEAILTTTLDGGTATPAEEPQSNG
jgi:anti-sigma factor RsiW